jgi:hypothetical protein
VVPADPDIRPVSTNARACLVMKGSPVRVRASALVFCRGFVVAQPPPESGKTSIERPRAWRAARIWCSRIWRGEERPANRRNHPTYPGVAPAGTRPRDLRSSDEQHGGPGDGSSPLRLGSADNAGRLGHVSRTRRAEVLSLAPSPRARSGSGDPSDVGTGRPLPQVKVLLIDERVEGFFLERLTDRGEPAGTTQHDTMDEAMHQAYSEYDAISDWRLCPVDTDPLEYIRSQSDV